MKKAAAESGDHIIEATGGNVDFDVETTGNLIEAAFWIVAGLLVAIAATRRGGPYHSLGLTAAVILALFGLSDVVESRTGAWWRPPWLLAGKAICLTGLAVCYLHYRRIRAARMAVVARSDAFSEDNRHEDP